MRHLPSVAIVFALLTCAAASHAKAPVMKPSIFELGRAELDPDWEDDGPDAAPLRPELVIRSDGSWWATGVEHGQRLTRAELKRLRSAIRATRFELLNVPGVHCLALPNKRISVRASWRRVTWTEPCSQHVPHGSVTALVTVAKALTIERPVVQPLPPVIEPTPDPTPAPAESPVLVSYRINRYRDFGGGEFVTIRKDGTYAAGGGKFDGASDQTKTGVLAADEVARLVKMLRAATFGPHPKPYACAAMLEGDGTLDAPGIGTSKWSVPCGQLHPSLEGVMSIVTGLLRR